MNAERQLGRSAGARRRRREMSFTKAAAKLGVSQPALSHTICQLETRVGVRLLNRTTRNVSLTEAGERLVRTVEPRFADIDPELAALGALRGPPDHRALRVALHAKAWQLAQSGRVRTRRALQPVPRPPHRGHRGTCTRGGGLAQASQCPPRQGRLALHFGRCPCEAEEPLSIALEDSGH